MVLNEQTPILLAVCAKEQPRLYKDILNGFTDLTLNPIASPPVKPLGSPNNSTSRLFFIKLSYLLRFGFEPDCALYPHRAIA